MHFTKMQGLGNDYVYIDFREVVPEDLPDLARQVSDRHFGVGSDGLIFIGKSDKADFSMRIFNSDGSEGEMCGNGIRCVGKYVYENGFTAKTDLRIDTLAGIKEIHLTEMRGKISSVTVDMGIPSWACGRTLSVDGIPWVVTPVSMGNPHIVTFYGDISSLELPVLGPQFEHHKAFPDRVNTEFVEVLAPDRLKMRVWERGSGETLACGTGACAALVAAVVNERAVRQAVVTLPGGELSVRWDEQDGHVYMTGPAVTVFEGDWPET